MRSMTGFGRGEATTNGWRVDVELSGVNRKQADISVHLPAALLELEAEARALLSKSISRGRISAKVSLSHTDTGDNRLLFDEDLARQYVAAAKRLSEQTGIDTRITAADLFRAPGIFRIDELGADPAEVRGALMTALENALSQLVRMQCDEGQHLRADLEARLGHIAEEVEGITALAPLVPAGYRKSLMKRLQEAGLELDLDDDRLLREIAIFAERCDVTEELTRLASHLGLFRTYLASDEPMGRSLDFLCQELNRELNTIGSKANDAGIARCVVHSKTELEKIREQVQNVQ
ncbi:MAG: YicC family protein [Verrucomicrobiaceae bacterium]|nr:YicC family protein [Verrucomicrobiaceae bacterium]